MQLIALLGALLALVPGTRGADDDAVQLQAILQKVAPSIVTVQAVVKMEVKGGEGSGADRESRVFMQGVVVDPQGLVLVSSLPFSPKVAIEAITSQVPDGFDVKMVPTKVTVVIGNESKEYDAFVAATDAPLGLTFIKIEDLAGRKLPAVDFSAPAAAMVGQRVVAVSRLRKGYDYAAYVETGRISGEIAKPRKAWMLDGGPGLGLPVFTTTSEMIGVVSLIASGVSDESGGSDAAGIGMLMRMFGGGGSPLRMFIVPGSAIRPLIDQANQQAVTVAAERAKKKAAQPATPPAKPAPK